MIHERTEKNKTSTKHKKLQMRLSGRRDCLMIACDETIEKAEK